MNDAPGDEWDQRAHVRLLGSVWRTCRRAAELYGEGEYRGHTIGVTVHPNRAKRMACLLRARDTWLLEMRSTPRADLTQGYVDELWAELMEAAEKQAEHDILCRAPLPASPERA